MFNENSLVTFFSKDNSLVTKVMYKLMNYIGEDSQIIIVDPKRYWQSTKVNSSTHFFFPDSTISYIHTIVNLANYINPRLQLIMLNDFPYFLRDYRGSGVKNTMINNRIYAYCHIILQKILSNGIKICLTTYTNPLLDNEPIFYNISKYFKVKVISIELINNELQLKNIRNEKECFMVG